MNSCPAPIKSLMSALQQIVCAQASCVEFCLTNALSAHRHHRYSTLEFYCEIRIRSRALVHTRMHELRGRRLPPKHRYPSSKDGVSCSRSCEAWLASLFHRSMHSVCETLIRIRACEQSLRTSIISINKHVVIMFSR